MVDHRTVVLDTNAYIYFVKGDLTIMGHILNADVVLIPSILIGELSYGFNKAKKKEDNFKILFSFLDEPQVFVVDVDETIARSYANIKYGLQKIGRPIPSNDIWIAACALSKNQPIITRDKHFDFIEGINIIR